MVLVEGGIGVPDNSFWFETAVNTAVSVRFPMPHIGWEGSIYTPHAAQWLRTGQRSVAYFLDYQSQSVFRTPGIYEMGPLRPGGSGLTACGLRGFSIGELGSCELEVCRGLRDVLLESNVFERVESRSCKKEEVLIAAVPSLDVSKRTSSLATSAKKSVYTPAMFTSAVALTSNQQEIRGFSSLDSAGSVRR